MYLCFVLSSNKKSSQTNQFTLLKFQEFLCGGKQDGSTLSCTKSSKVNE